MSEKTASAVSEGQSQPIALPDAIAYLMASDPTFAVTQITLHGIGYTAFRNCPDSVADLLGQSRPQYDDGAADYLVFGIERWA